MKRILFLCLVALFLVESDVYAGDVVYGKNSRLKKEQLAVPYFQKKPNASINGGSFMLQADKMKFWELEDFIVSTVLQGNVPQELKYFRKIVFKT